MINQIIDKNKSGGKSLGKDGKDQQAGLYLPPISSRNLLKMSVEEKNYAINNNIQNIKQNALNPKRDTKFVREMSPGEILLQNKIEKMYKVTVKLNKEKAASLNPKPYTTQMEKIANERKNLLPKIQSKYLDQIRKSREDDILNNDNDSKSNKIKLEKNRTNSPYKYDDQKITKIMEIKKRYNISPAKIQNVYLYEEQKAKIESKNMLDVNNNEDMIENNDLNASYNNEIEGDI